MAYKKSTSGTKPNFKIVINSPVVLTFSAICVLALVLDKVTARNSTALLFSVYRSGASMASPFTYLRFFGHVFGHLDISHLTSNLMMLLILGPMLEERYGGKILTAVIAVTALITGVASFILFPNQALMGASGVVFAFILLASFTSFKEREIPLTFILVAILYIGQQIYQGIFVDDNVSQFTHILGGITGSVLGYNLNKK
ncbi:MAG: rhomboid family intramembrane serine protease [Lachnospiraceae bacterium]|nr:rhomboid family intramembrane serine protease [Lachnospiraceae bacterium]MBP5533586.1 rhomboid family intramembrane serine protease [Lachnospiraceae bacterium]